MFDKKKRREELRKIWNDAEGNFRIIDFINLIISQEKSMIAEAEKNARKEFAEKLRKKLNSFLDGLMIDNLLKEYEEK